MIALSRPRRSALLVVLLGVLLAVPAALRVDDALAVSYKSCTLTDSEAQPAGGEPTYNLTVKRSKVTCQTAKKVVNAFHRCRSTTSTSCKKTLLSHWRCTGKKESSIATMFYGTLNCTYGTRRVRSSYQQNT